MAAQKRYNRCLQVILLLALLFAFIPTTVQAKEQQLVAAQQEGNYVYPIERGDSDYQTKYEENLTLILGNLGTGYSWTIPAGKKVSFNDSVGSLRVGHKLANWIGQEVYGAGACDIATWFYFVAIQEDGLEASATENDEHPAIPGVPLDKGITIYQPGKDMWIENTTSEDIVIRWDTSSNPGNVIIWVDKPGGDDFVETDPNALTIIDQSQESPAEKSPFIFRWGYLLYTILFTLILAFLVRDRIILGINDVYRNREKIKQIHKQAIRESFQYWAVVFVGTVLIIPELGQGFSQWLYGQTTFRNLDLLLLAITLLLTLMHKNIRKARLVKELETGERKNRFVMFIVFLALIPIGIIVGWFGYKQTQSIVFASDEEALTQMVEELSPMADNFIDFVMGQSTPVPPSDPNLIPTYTGDTRYVGVYGAINGWGTLGQTSNAQQAVDKALAYVETQRSWLSGNIVPVVNVRVGSVSVITEIIELCRGKCVVMVDVTPNQDVTGLIQTFAPLGDHVWFDVDLEHKGSSTSARQFNDWAKQYFDIRQSKGFTSLGVFAFYDFISTPQISPPSSIVWSYNNGQGLVVPIFDGHCTGSACKDSKFNATRKVLSNYPGALATGIMEFSSRWGCGSQYGDCGFTNQQYFEEFKPLIFMSQ